MTVRYREHMHSNEPVHTWPLLSRAKPPSRCVSQIASTPGELVAVLMFPVTTGNRVVSGARQPGHANAG